VSFEVEGALKPPVACHCSQCRQQSGHVWASTNVALEKLTLRGADNLTWFQSSETVRRGFCSTCGGFLFWDSAGRRSLAVAMGAFETPTDTRLAMHIYVADKGDYYDIADGLPQNQQ
jgi:hypothetical protein